MFYVKVLRENRHLPHQEANVDNINALRFAFKRVERCNEREASV